MLPKIFVGYSKDRKSFLEKHGLSENYVLSIDALEVNISEFREWVTFCQNVLDERGEYTAIVWNAEKLSPECQGVLLKPLEEKKPATKFFLLVEKETDLLPTILSRCEVVKGEIGEISEVYWKDLLRVWRAGAGECLGFAEKFELEQLESMFSEVINKVKGELKNQVNVKRIKIVNIVFEILLDLQSSAGINRRMALESFLLRSWKVIKTPQQQAV